MTTALPRIVFLDIDGPLCSIRAALARGDHGIVRMFDPVAIEFLNRLHEAAPYDIVVSSTWRREGNIPLVLQAAGIRPMCHTDWATPYLDADRPREIEDWLSRREPCQWLILDDDSFAWTLEQHARWVKCDAHDGISLEAMQQAFTLFGTTWPQVQRETREGEQACTNSPFRQWSGVALRHYIEAITNRKPREALSHDVLVRMAEDALTMLIEAVGKTGAQR